MGLAPTTVRARGRKRSAPLSALLRTRHLSPKTQDSSRCLRHGTPATIRSRAPHFCQLVAAHETVGTASVIKGSPTTVGGDHVDAAAAPPQNAVARRRLKQANAPTPAPPVPRAGLHKAFPKETRGIEVRGLQRHEPFAQHRVGAQGL